VRKESRKNSQQRLRGGVGKKRPMGQKAKKKKKPKTKKKKRRTKRRVGRTSSGGGVRLMNKGGVLGENKGKHEAQKPFSITQN